MKINGNRVRCTFFAATSTLMLVGSCLGAASVARAAVPILFNDHHVAAKPSELKAGRVLAALVRGETILVPLRSMFEEMGGGFSYDPATKTAEFATTGTTIRLRVGKPEVLVNGEMRPLDVPPEINRGVLMVPVRVISEALGAYVLWVPQRSTVVIRYVPAPVPSAVPATPLPIPSAPMATGAPAPAPLRTPSPPSSPTPTPKARTTHAYVASDALIDSKIANELAPGVRGATSFDVKGAVELPVGPTQVMIGGDFRQYQYTHPANRGFVPCPAASVSCSTVVGGAPTYRGGPCPSGDPGCVTVIGHGAYEAALGAGQAYVPSFIAQDRDVDARIGAMVIPDLYVGASYVWRTFDYLGYPTQRGLGFGLEKLPDLEKPFSLYGSAYYYPSVSGTYTGPVSSYLGSLSGATFTWQYRVLKYEAGATYAIRRSPVFLEASFVGDVGSGKENAPSNYAHTAIDIGAGLHL